MAPPPRNNSGSGCLSAILHRLLCRNGLPTHPSIELDNVANKETVKSTEAKRKVVLESAEKPGIVARLMGLETLPDPRMKNKLPGTVPRSRSVNFMDYLLEIDLRHVQQHRRVRTSVSFRDVAPQQPVQQDPLILYLDELDTEWKGAKSKELSNGDHHGCEELKLKNENKKREKCGRGAGKEKVVSKLTDEPKTKSKKVHSGRQSRMKECANYKESKNNGNQRAGKLIQEKEVMAESKFITKKRKERKATNNRVVPMPPQSVETDCSSVGSSPYSILDLDYGATSQESSIQDDEKTVNFSPRRDSPPHEPTIRDWFNAFQSAVSLEANSSVKEERQRYWERSSLDSREAEYCLEAALEVCRLTEEDIKNWSSSWIGAEQVMKLSEFEEICVTIEQRILDLVLEQLVGDLHD